jgi:hypothetical protein
MRADYATSDLISKVNSDWINAVLVNRELDRAHGDDAAADDLMLQSGFGRQIIPLWPKPAPAAKSRAVEGPLITVEAIATPSRCRSVARRVTERMALAVAALAVAWMGIQMAPELNSTSEQAISALPGPATPITTELRPAWLLPEILYGPAMASSPISAPRPGR